MREQMKTIACHPERSEGSAVEFSLFEPNTVPYLTAVAFSMLVMNSLRQATGSQVRLARFDLHHPHHR
jgi:hypothetical protein